MSDVLCFDLVDERKVIPKVRFAKMSFGSCDVKLSCHLPSQTSDMFPFVKVPCDTLSAMKLSDYLG